MGWKTNKIKRSLVTEVALNQTSNWRSKTKKDETSFKSQEKGQGQRWNQNLKLKKERELKAGGKLEHYADKMREILLKIGWLLFLSSQPILGLENIMS